MRVLITGMSGTGKSTVTRALAQRGFRAIDLDTPDYSELVPAVEGEVTGVGGGMDWVWREDRVSALLDSAGPELLFLSGCSPNQGRFYNRLDRRILLTAPPQTIVQRLASRTGSDFGKRPEELAATLTLIETVEPLLRRRANVVIDTTAPLNEVLARVIQIATGA